MKDIKYIIKRILIGVGIALAIMFIKENVYAYEWEAQGDVAIESADYTFGEYLAWVAFGAGQYSAPTYPRTNNIFLQGNSFSGSSTYTNSGVLSNRGPYSARFITGARITLDSYTFEPGTDYYVIVPFPYTSDIFDSLSADFNEDYLINPNNYSATTGVNISSSVFSFGSDNPFPNSDTYPYIFYWKIMFTVSEQISNIQIDIGDLDTSHTRTVTGYNTFSFTDYIGHTRFQGTSWANYIYLYYSPDTYKPLLYTGTPGAPIIDGNDTLSDVTSDIKTQITNIINGVFDENLDFPYMNGGGRPFGDNEYTLQDLLIVPLNFAKSIAENYDTCTGVEIPIPGFNSTFTLPCITSFITGFAPSTFVTMIQTIFGCVISFNLILALYRDIQYALSPKDAMYLDSFI